MTTPAEAPPPVRLIVLLDSGPLGAVTHPRGDAEAQQCKAWLARILAAGRRVLIPEVCYYETRRELRRSELRSGVPSRGLANLETLAADAGLVPLTSATMRLASDFWADARHRHLQGASDAALDADVILCAQAALLRPDDWGEAGASVVIATGNVGHLARFADARDWRTIG